MKVNNKKTLTHEMNTTSLKVQTPLAKANITTPAGKSKKDKGKLKKELLIKALKEKTVLITQSPALSNQNETKNKKKKNTNKKKEEYKQLVQLTKPQISSKDEVLTDGDRKKSRKRNRKHKSTDKVEVPCVAKKTAMNIQETENTDITSVSKKTKKRNKKRKKSASKNENVSGIESTKIEKKTAETTTSTTLNPDGKKPHKRHRRNRKSAEKKEIINTTQKEVKVIEDDAASSDSEPELIQADWELAKDSDSEQDDEKHESDLDESEEDVDEDDDDDENDAISSDESDSDGSTFVEEKKTKSATDFGEVDTESIDIKEIERPAVKTFSLQDKSKILKEMTARSVNLESRCIYMSPIPPNCTFEMLKKLSPKMTCCRLFTKSKSGKLRSFAFLEYSDEETAKKEQRQLAGRLFGSQVVRAECRGYKPPLSPHTDDQIDFSRLLVCGLLPTVNTSDLQTIFPSSSSIRLSSAPGFSSNLGSAILHFVSDAVALDAFSQWHGFLLKGHAIDVNFLLKSSVAPTTKEMKKIMAEKALVRPETAAVAAKPTQTAVVTAVAKPVAAPKPKVIVQTMINSDEEDDDDDPLTAETLTHPVATAPLQSAIASVSSVKVMKSVDASKNTISQMFKQVLTNKAAEKESSSEDENDDSEDDEDEEEEEEEGDSDDEDSASIDEDEDIDDNIDDESDEEKEDEELAKLNAEPNSSDDEAEASLSAALSARKACAKALKAPGAKRNWKAGAPIRQKKTANKRPGTMPTILPVPGKRRR